MAIAARKKGIEIAGTTASVKKTMRSNPRMIDCIDIAINFNINFDEKTRTILDFRHDGQTDGDQNRFLELPQATPGS